MFGLTMSLAELLQQYLSLGQLVSETVALFFILALAFAIAWAGHSVFKKYLLRWASKTETKLDDEIVRNVRAPIFLLAILFGVYYGLEGFASLQVYSQSFVLAFMVAEILVITFIVTRIATILISWYAEESVKRERKVSNHILFILKKAVQIVVYTFAFLAVLVVFRIDLSGVVVGLGVSGIAIALALQNLLSDAFSAFSIYFDRPFEIGDFIVVGEYAGTVNKIGMKSTRIQLLQGEELVMSNKELTTKSVRNFKKLQRRRIVLTVRVTCDTPIEKLRRIPEILTKIMKKTEIAELDRVHFRQFGEFSLDFEIVYYIKTGDYSKYMDIQQIINYGILEEFEKEDIKMAYPTQKVFLCK
jgi:small-conductance mechanosensitive channel